MANLDQTFQWPSRVNIDQEGLDRLTSMLRDTYSRITRELSTATDFGIYNRQRILAQIDAWLTSLGIDVQDFFAQEIPAFYATGGQDAVKALNDLGADIKAGFSFNQINQEAVSALYSDASRSFATAITGVSRSAQQLLNVAVKKQITNDIASGLTSGQTLIDTVKMIKGTLADNGLEALVDKGGRAWSLDDYATMLYQTKAAEARNLGMVNTMAANGYDLVQVSAHGATDVCADWEGQILSTTGATKSFDGEDVATVDEATADGLFHPNCRHTLNPIADEQLAKDAYYYTGQAVDTGEVDDLGRPIYDYTYQQGLPGNNS